MSLEQLKRLENINKTAVLYPGAVQPIHLDVFAILNDKERDLCLMYAEDLIKKARAGITKGMMN